MIFLIIFILSIVSFMVGVTINKNTQFGSYWNDKSAILFGAGLMFAFFSGIIMPQYENTNKLYPVEYTVTKSNTHIAVATNYGVFNSDKIKDLTDWSLNKPGFIKVKYNVFGFECQEYTFITE